MYKKKSVFVVLMLFTVLFSAFIPSALSFARQINGTEISEESHMKKVTSSKEFSNYQEYLVSDIPLYNKEILDINGKPIGWIIQYELMIENTDSKSSVENLSINESVSSLFTYLYFNDKKEENFILVDYSKIATEGFINVMELKNNKSKVIEQIPVSDFGEKLENVAEEIKLEKNNAEEVALEKLESNNQTRAYTCNWWVCTKTESGGGNWDDPCNVVGSVLCTLPKSTVTSLICAAGVAIACYVPKYTVCVNGYWETKRCPIEAR